MSKACFVYVVGHEHSVYGHAVKVGISDSVGGRIAQFQTGNCEDLNLHFAFKLPSRELALRVEADFHDKFSDWRIRGEWFGMPPDGAIMLLTFFIANTLCDGGRGNIAAMRRDAGLLDAFERLDVMPPEFHERWNDEWHTHVVDAPQ